MSQKLLVSNTSINKTISLEQFNQIIEAILEGKYSWACVLLLRSAGYNPLQYIPYRTYNRLAKENDQIGMSNSRKTNVINLADECHAVNSNSKSSGNCLSKIADLSCLEKVGEKPPICGSNLEQCSRRII